MPPLRTLTLTERTTTRCRLPPADAAFLLRHHASHLRLVPAGPRHRYALTPTHRVGVIDTPARRLLIQPKIPLRNVFFLLDPSAPLPPPTGAGDAVLAYLAARLAAQMADRAAAGLHRGYAAHAVQGTYLHGSLDVPAQLRERRREQLHSRHDDLSVDVPCNQLPLTLALALGSVAGLEEAEKTTLRQTVTRFAGVRQQPLTPALLAAASAGRVPDGYAPLLQTCQLLAEGLLTGSAPAFLLDLERLFERFVTGGVETAFRDVKGAAVAAQQTVAGGLEMRPDVTVARDGQAALVLDVKWKRLPAGGVIAADAYQVVAYCTALRVGRGVLVYPGKRDRVRELAVGDVRLAVRTLDLTGEPERCPRGLSRLGRWLRGMV